MQAKGDASSLRVTHSCYPGKTIIQRFEGNRKFLPVLGRLEIFIALVELLGPTINACSFLASELDHDLAGRQTCERTPD